MSIKILQISSEVAPIVKSGGLADVVAGLTQALNELGHDCRIVIPKYSFLSITDLNAEVIDEFSFEPISGQMISSTVYKTKMPDSDSILYLISASDGFEQPSLYPTEVEGEQHRFIVYGLIVQEWIRRMRWKPDIIHGHDWMAGAYFYFNSLETKSVPTLMTIHNAKYQGGLNRACLGKYSELVSSVSDELNLLKMGLSASTTINTVSDTYAKEIHTPEYGYGIETIIRSRTKDVYGIVNGLDLNRYSTENNNLVIPEYSTENVHQVRPIHKLNLLQRVGLKDRHKPLFAVVGRTGSQKGMDVLAEALVGNNELMANLNLIILVGKGTKRIEDLLEDTAAKFPESLYLSLGFNDDFSHQIYAAADFIVMPSRYEPCGLSQMIGMRYGSIPVVRRTGGLADTVLDCDENENGSGIVYINHTANDLAQALMRAVDLYADKSRMRKLIVRNMKRDFSWTGPVEEYVAIYRKTLETANYPS